MSELIKFETGLVVPDFMKGGDDGLGNVQDFLRPGRIKIVQKQSRNELLELFDIGSVIVPPDILVSPTIKNDKGRATDRGTPFVLTPLFFFAEWTKVNPVELGESEPMIVDRTFDVDHPVAVRARSQDRMEPHPARPDLFIRYVENLNFVVRVHMDGLYDQPLLLSFSRAEHRTGSNFLTKVKMRRAPLYGCNFKFATRQRANAKGEWWGFEIEQPDAHPFVDAATFAENKTLHEQMREAHLKNLIHVDYDDESSESTPTSSEF